MNPAAILALISDMYAQIGQLTQERALLAEENASLRQAAEAVTPAPAAPPAECP